MMKTKRLITRAVALSALFLAHTQASAATVFASDLDYGISGTNSNSFAFDFSGEPIWTAGSQRSENGSVDPNNRRAGRVFVDFQLDAGIIAAASQPGATVSLMFSVNSIGGGVAGTPNIDGLDLRFFGANAVDRTANTLWNTAGVGTEQSDILAVGGPLGSSTVMLTNASVLSSIAGATPGQYVSFGFLNSVGTVGSTPVGNSTAETYGFQMSQTTGNYALSVVPEPGIFALVGLTGFAMMLRRRGRR